MKVFYLIDGLGPGGAERSLVEVAPLLRERGVELVTFALHERWAGFERDLQLADLPVRRLSSRRLVPAAFALRRAVLAERPDLIHTTLFQSDVVGRFAAIGTGVPVLTSLVNTSYDRVRLRDPNVSRLGLWGVRSIDGWTARNLTDHFHAVTESVKASAVRSLGIDGRRITVIQRGRDPQRLGTPSAERRAAARRALGLGADDQVLVNVGRQEFQKGQRYLLDMMNILAESHPRSVLLIAGREGVSTPELRRIHTLHGLGDRVRFLGHRTDVPCILSAGDVFVFPSLYEGMGGAVIEAMALARPIVASSLPALREVVEDGRSGILVEPCAPQALAAAVDRLLDDRSMAAAYGKRGRHIFEDRFTIETSASQMIALYDRLQRDRRNGCAGNGA